MIIDESFGKDVHGNELDVGGFIGHLIKSLPKLGAVDSRIVLQDQYETFFGIYNHLASKDRPLASVAMFPQEDYTENSPLYDALSDYAENGYNEIWGMSLKEFLDQPRYVVKMMREISLRIKEKKLNAVNNALNESGLK